MIGAPVGPDAERRAGPGSSVQALPAGRVASINTDDTDELMQHAGGWSVQYQVLDGTALRSTLSVVTTSSLQVALVQQSTGYSSQGTNPVHTLSIVVPVDGRLMVHRARGIGPLEAGMTRSGEEYECVCRAGASFIVASLACEVAERHAADLWHEPDALGHTSDRLEFDDATHRSRYVEACRRIMRVVQSQPGVLDDRDAAAALEEEFLEALLLNTHPAAVEAHERHRYNLARRAYAYLQNHANDVPSIRELCAVTGASYATLERGFRETYGLTPKAMMTAMRLAGARRALLHPTPATRVAHAALRWGFVEFGRFSAQYRQRYGEAPSETLRRVRGEGPPLNRSDPR